MNAFFRSGSILAITCIIMTCINSAASAQNIIHVDIANGSLNPPDNGTLGWGANAFRFLQDALAAADGQFPSEENPVEIWVASAYRYNQESPPQLVPYPYRPDQRATNGPAAPCRPYGDCDRKTTFDL